MLVVHEALRRSYGRMPDLIRQVRPGDIQRAEIVADHVQLMETFLHLHHKGEDDLLWPKLLERASDRIEATVAIMESQHEEIAERLAESSDLLSTWRNRPSRDSGEALADCLALLGRLLDEHLAIEEKEILPLVPDYITAKEWHQLGDHAINALPKNKLPIVFGMLASIAEPEVVKLMLSSAPLVPRLIMPALGPKAYSRHARKLYASGPSGS
ncbi:hemerythrin domain-containing protein [Streptomyces sp. NPDC001380]|uniref:hemerythrin domain-containing protein n=1 Tax=Streptomyces sp. NPDC001380 TaxID=3364566 RepID=UPI0036889B73